MEKPFNRRDFLKFAGLLSVNLAVPQFLFRPGNSVDGSGENVLIIVFDAFSALHISLYGYGRETMPNLARIADKGTVYHQHYANGPFTTPGTASLLTGTLPWTHRALDHGDGVAADMVDKGIFHAFNEYHCMAYSHNTLANTLLKQFLPAIDDYTSQGRLFLGDDAILYDLKDSDIAPLAWTRMIKQDEDGASYSLFMSRLYEFLNKDRFSAYKADFPRGIPNIYQDSFYILEDGIDWVQTLVATAPQPFMGYFHFLPPHFPYNTRADFYDQFYKDGFETIEKPIHIFAPKRSEGRIDEFRRWYDEYILYVDSEFARLYRYMEQNGLLENTWLVLTSDHGEMFERGIIKHTTLAMSQPVVRVPLMIFGPQIDSRVDIHQSTNAIDVLPTFASLMGQEIPDWCEGIVMPPFQASGDERRQAHYSMNLTKNAKYGSLENGSIALVKDPYKLVYYYGYNELDSMDGEAFELYDLKQDPEELNNLYHVEKKLAQNLLGELKTKLVEVNKLYTNSN